MTEAEEEFCRRYLGAVACLDRGEIVAARREFEILVLDAPRFAPAWDGLGRCHEAEGELERAVDCFRRSVRLDRQGWRSRFHWGVALHRGGDLKAAAARLREAARLAPEERRILRSLGLVHYDAGEYEQALGAYRRALELPEREVLDAQLWLDIGRAESERGDHEAAEAAYERACFLCPDDPELFYHWALVCRRRGDMDGAQRLAERARALQPASLQYRLLPVTLAMDSGRPELAAERIDALQDLPGTERLREALRAELARRVGSPERARTHALRALSTEGPLCDQAVDRALATLREIRGQQVRCRGFRFLLEVVSGESSYFRPYVVLAESEEQALEFVAEMQDALDASAWHVVERESFEHPEDSLAGIYQVLLTRVLFPREPSAPRSR